MTKKIDRISGQTMLEESDAREYLARKLWDRFLDGGIGAERNMGILKNMGHFLNLTDLAKGFSRRKH